MASEIATGVKELTWSQICAKVDELLETPESRVHKFPWAKERKKPEVRILPHGARQFKMNWDFGDEGT